MPVNYKFRKLPVVIEAFQMTRERRTDTSEWPRWLHYAWNLEPGVRNSVYAADMTSSRGPLSIHTLEGVHTVSWDDYIIQGVAGELYPCRPDIFESTYEAAK
jgi:hypothetical protein